MKELQKKELYISTAEKGGVGKTTAAQNIMPVIIYRKTADEKLKGNLQFNIVEIDDNAAHNTWSSEKISYKKYDVSEYKDAIVQIQRTFANSNTVEILDIGGGGDKTKQLLQHISKMRLDEIFNLNFIVPTNRDTAIYQSTKSTLELIHSLFGCKSTLVYNKVVNNVNEEFQAFFGNPKFKIKSRFAEIEKYVKDEWIVYDDIHSLLGNSINETKQSTLDFYINAEYIVNNWIQYRLEALNSENENAIDEAMRIYDISYDFIDFFKKINFEVKR
ncbi:hypothetical protein CRU98_05715 [Arcobacter sp. CECT 8986]|uniref:hypothetical protein n=1 Tax=Arcobacter sp. CECT 8986 TaxID=2044507 RepID=UPI001009A7CC|nr:hypothetical protein [Arcobacter sp. CECT 8986]RXJ99524.1 hypothetical protein CRU98_05715 [Arcobacter sp. CECT 8986]